MRSCECWGFRADSPRTPRHTGSRRPRHAAIAVATEKRSDERLIVPVLADILDPVRPRGLPRHANDAPALCLDSLSTVCGANAGTVKGWVGRSEYVAISARVGDLVLAIVRVLFKGVVR